MELGTFAPRERDQISGDQLQAKEAVDKPLIALVREHREGMTTKYKPNGDGIGVICDLADTRADEVWIDVLWMNGAVVDNLVPFLGQAVPIKLAWTPSQGGGNPYISVKPLEGAELAVAQQWAAKNPNRFETERAQRVNQKDGFKAAAPAAAPTPAASVPATNGSGTVAPADPNDPAVAALLAQLGAQQVAAS